MNAYEYYEYGPMAGTSGESLIPPEGAQLAALKELTDVLNFAANTNAAPITKFCDHSTRELINRAMTAQGLKQPVALTASFIDLLSRMKLTSPKK